MSFDLPDFSLESFVQSTLAEDMGAHGDVTSTAIIPASARFAGALNAREDLVAAGLPIAEAFFRALDPHVQIVRTVSDGDFVTAGTALFHIQGQARALLTAERPALNIVQHLSGIATLTRSFVAAIAGTRAILLDTRKTTAGLRVLEKYATRLGGAQNHRMRLDDGILIKDNHLAVAGSVSEAVARARAAQTSLTIEVECDTLDQVREALAAGADKLLLDNMAPEMLREAVALVSGRIPCEASGGVRLETVRAIAETGVDYISVGRITQSAPAVDIGFDVALAPPADRSS